MKTGDTPEVAQAIDLLRQLPEERQHEAARYIKVLGSVSMTPPKDGQGVEHLFGVLDQSVAEDMKLTIKKLCGQVDPVEK